MLPCCAGEGAEATEQALRHITSRDGSLSPAAAVQSSPCSRRHFAHIVSSVTAVASVGISPSHPPTQQVLHLLFLVQRSGHTCGLADDPVLLQFSRKGRGRK